MSTSARWMTSVIGTECTRTSNIERSTSSGFIPWLIVRFPCGSRSTTSTVKPCSLSATARFRVVVVFATPPFWLARAMTCPKGLLCEVGSRESERATLPRRLIEAFLSSEASTILLPL